MGTIINGRVVSSPAGEVVEAIWQGLPERFAGVELDTWVLLPNHVHGIVVLPWDKGGKGSLPALGEIIRAFKGASTHAVRAGGPKTFAWQPNYWEHVIRSEKELARIRTYIVNNPRKWELDQENPDAKISSV